MGKMKISRRRLMGNALGFAVASSIPLCWYLKARPKPPKINVYRPGMEIGHVIRNHTSMLTRQYNGPEPVATWNCDLMIIGSGAAALSAAWKLKREGNHNFILLEGPEPNGNNAGYVNAELRYPSSAHYLALPSKESTHIREMLADVGVLHGDPYAHEPEYDEMVVVHAQEERLLNGKKWQDTMLPEQDGDSQRFFQLVQELSQANGDDGLPLFAIPRSMSSKSSPWQSLDRITFAQWLADNNYTSESLLWYLNYCCRDDYGQGIHKVSAWAGLHYYACRTGHAKYAEKGAVLTWPDGLASLSNKLRDFVAFDRYDATKMPKRVTLQAPGIMSGSLITAIERPDHVELLLAVGDLQHIETVRVRAQKVISAMPLYMAGRLIHNMGQYGFKASLHMPEYAPWMVSNFVFTAFPQEQEGTVLAWDNVVKDGPGLGYVVCTHQLIRAAKPERTAFTAYYALDEQEPVKVREWLVHANDDELVEKAACDLKLAYPSHLWDSLEQIDITLRGHAMASPTPGYLSNAGLIALQNNNSRILFAHSDMSGYSVFEEAAWWGYQAALKCLKV